MSRSLSRTGGFTLVEMLAVMGVAILLLALVVPAFIGVLGGRNITSSAYQIAGVLEQARTYAVTNHTYVWVGFLEEDGSASSPSTPLTTATGAGGRVILSVVASSDGTRYNDGTVDGNVPVSFPTPVPVASATPASTSTNQVNLVQINKLIKIDNVHMGTLNTTATPNVPLRPAVLAAYQVGDLTFALHSSDAGIQVTNKTTFPYPLIGTPLYTFYKAIEFDPQGEASKIVDSIDNGMQKWLEIGLQPTHGSAIDPNYQGTNATKAAAAIMVEGITGRVEILRP